MRGQELKTKVIFRKEITFKNAFNRILIIEIT